MSGAQRAFRSPAAPGPLPTSRLQAEFDVEEVFTSDGPAGLMETHGQQRPGSD